MLHRLFSLVVIRSIFLLLLFPIFTKAQSINGNLEGRIADERGRFLPSVNVVLKGLNLQGERGTASNHEGNFSFRSIHPGTYNLKISSVGSTNSNIENINIYLGKTTNIGIINLVEHH